MLLYEDNRAPNPRRVNIFLAEKGIELKRHQVDIMASELKTGPLKKLNPLERVPFLLLDDGTVIAETIAICRYFEELQPDPVLMGTGALEKAIIEMWQRRIENNFLTPVAHCFRHSHPAMAPLESPQIGEWSKVNGKLAMQMINFLESELGGRDYIAGDAFSIADITALCTVDFMRLARLSLGDEHANMKRWYERVAARPSASA